jgi:AGCS family alanine or glycine:cation symporter
MFKVLIVTKEKEDGVSSFGALCTAIGGQVGTGNLAGVATAIVSGGAKKISSFAQVVVPFMAMFYVLISLFVILKNIGKMPEVFGLIVASAFGVRSVAGGVLGFTVKQAFRYGTARGLFSNEAG